MRRISADCVIGSYTPVATDLMVAHIPLVTFQDGTQNRLLCCVGKGGPCGGALAHVCSMAQRDNGHAPGFDCAMPAIHLIGGGGTCEVVHRHDAVVSRPVASCAPVATLHMPYHISAYKHACSALQG